MVTDAQMSRQPDTVFLTVEQLVKGRSYKLTIHDVADTATSANTIWPGSGVSFAAEFPRLPTAGRLANISARVQVSGGDRILIAGFMARGSGMKRVMLRAIGPSLSSAGIRGVLANPVLELYDSSGALLAENDDWEENSNRQEIVDTGIAPLSPDESVILRSLPASTSGNYTVVLRSASGAPGVGLVEVYDLDRGDDSELVNISSRGFVQSDDNVMIGGVIVAGPTSRKIILRALGPSLPLELRLANPSLDLVDRNGAVVAKNDDWRTAQEAAIIATGVPPSNDLESAIVTKLRPGAYTAIVRGMGDGTGAALVEAYALE